MRSRITCHSTIIILVNMPLWVKALYNYVGNQTTMVDGYDNQRLQSEGVSSDEELEKMIKYQQAYNAKIEICQCSKRNAGTSRYFTWTYINAD